MIHRLYSDDPGFKTLEFQPGFNVLIADKDPKATERQSRNGAGKSSFVRLVHFLLGGSCNKGECMFLDPALQPYTFGMEMDLGGERIAVERSASKPSRVFISKGASLHWPIKPRSRSGDPRRYLTNEEWKTVLGAMIFQLQPLSDDERAEKFIPTFRTLFPYFARLNENGAFLEPYKIHSDQQLWSQQVAIAFLLGLDWRIPQGMQLVRTRERMIRQLKEALEDAGPVAGRLLPSSDDLQAQLTVAMGEANRVKKSLETYSVNPEYHALEAEADSITAEIAKTFDEDTWDRELVTGLEQALAAEVPPDPKDLERLYEGARIELPGVALKRFEEVRTFHESVLRNRESYLRGELTAARARLDERAARRNGLDARRSELMAILSSTGALDQFTQMQAELGRLEGRAEALRKQTTAAKQIEDTKLQLSIEAAELELRLARNHDEQSVEIEQAQTLFAEISSELYERPGTLSVNRKLTGPPVRASIHGQESAGINKMKIFCFDLMMSALVLARQLGPRFLIHDSHLFDGVDPRQVTHALRIGSRDSVDRGFQYIVTINSDKLSSIRNGGLDLEQFAVPVRLTDQPNGGLFGKRFG